MISLTVVTKQWMVYSEGGAGQWTEKVKGTNDP